MKEEVDIHDFDRRLRYELAALERSNIDPENKRLIREFIEDLQDGWIPKRGGKKPVMKARWPKYLMHLRVIAQIIEDNGIEPKSFLYLDEAKVKQLRRLLVRRLKAGSRKPDSWRSTAYDYAVCFKKFMRWLREEKGYPEGYENRELHANALLYTVHPLETAPLQFAKRDPLETVDIREIPTDQELIWLYEAALNLRDKCFFAMWREHGNRIGGLGSLQVGDIAPPDKWGILVTMRDKTIKGEQIRFIHAQKDIIAWLNAHPRRDDPDAPFWINLEKWNKKGIIEPLSYDDFRRIIDRAKERHNKRYADDREKQITKNIRPHLARYTAFRRKRKQGVPEHVICKESGLVDGSKQIELYGKFDRTDIDEYYEQMANARADRPPELRSCPRCEQIQKGSNSFCERCGSPMDLATALKYESELEERVKRLEAYLGLLSKAMRREKEKTS